MAPLNITEFSKLGFNGISAMDILNINIKTKGNANVVESKNIDTLVNYDYQPTNRTTKT